MYFRSDDLIVFGKIVSTAFLIGGYIGLGYLLGDFLSKRGYSDGFVPGCMFLGAVIGLHQAWLLVRSILQQVRNHDKNGK